MINTFKEKGATHIDTYINRFDDESIDSIEFTGVKNYFETDDELKLRLKKEQNEKDSIRWKSEQERIQYEMKLLEQLKEKYKNYGK